MRYTIQVTQWINYFRLQPIFGCFGKYDKQYDFVSAKHDYENSNRDINRFDYSSDYFWFLGNQCPCPV